MRGPYRGCEHFGAMLYGRRRAECTRCGAAWLRQDDGPWRLVDAGREPSTPDGFVCEGCGARARIAPRTCLVCGRPSRSVTIAATVPLGEVDDGLRSD